MAGNTESFYPRLHQLKNQEHVLQKKDFLEYLYNISNSKCKDFLASTENMKNCQKNLMIASSCVLLQKANVKIGELRDSVGDCLHEIELSQKDLIKNYKDFPTRTVDIWLKNLSLCLE